MYEDPDKELQDKLIKVNDVTSQIEVMNIVHEWLDSVLKMPNEETKYKLYQHLCRILHEEEKKTKSLVDKRP